MPKKKKSVEEDSELEEEIKEDELEEIIEKISEKEIPESNIKEREFKEFLQTESIAPSLEQVAGEQELTGRFFPASGIGREDNEGNSTNYSLAKYEKPSESKYDEAPRNFQEEVSTGATPNIDLDRNSELRQQDFTFSTPEAQRMQRDVKHDAKSDYLQPERFEQKNQMPFEKEDRKYKKFKP